MATPDGSVARRFAVLALLVALALSVAMSLRRGPDSGHCGRTRPAHHRHHRHLVPDDDVHAHQMDPPFRRVRRSGRIAGRPGRGRGHRARDALAAQPDHLRGRCAVRSGAVVRQRQRLVVRLEFRCAVVESVPRVALRLRHDAARPVGADAAARHLLPFFQVQLLDRGERRRARPVGSAAALAAGDRGLAGGVLRGASRSPSA